MLDTSEKTTIGAFVDVSLQSAQPLSQTSGGRHVVYRIP